VALSDRSITAGMVKADRWIAPRNFIAEMFAQLPSHVEVEFSKYWQPQPGQGPVISTLPMPALMNMLSYGERVPFYSSTALSVKAKLRQCIAYATLMFPDPNVAFTRASITGDELIVEVPNFNFDSPKEQYEKPSRSIFMQQLAEQNARNAAMAFGFEPDDVSEVTWHKQPYAKIVATDERTRKHFIYWATHNHNTFSLGRFATWRPGLLLDDLLKDIELINGWIAGNERYNLARAR
jgi:hypothetical protein